MFLIQQQLNNAGADIASAADDQNTHFIVFASRLAGYRAGLNSAYRIFGN